jgi:hypothetical protein
VEGVLVTFSREENLELITRLKDHAGVQAAREEIRAQRDEYYSNLARSFYSSKDPVDQREIDYKRGVWWGAMWAYTLFLQNAGTRLDRMVDERLAAEEGDE